MSILKMYLSQEDNLSDAELVEAELGIEIPEVEPVTEEEEYEAEAVIAEIATDNIQQEIQDDVMDRLRDETETQIAALEQYLEVLQFGLENKEYSPQFAATVHAAMGNFSDLFGEETPKASLENYSHDNLEEFYTVAAEDFSEKLWKLEKTLDKIMGAPINTIVDKVVGTSRTLRARAIRKKADALLEKIAGVEVNGKFDVPVTGMQSRLAMKNVLPTNLLAGVQADQKSLSEIFTKYAEDGFKHCKFLYVELGEAVKKLRDGQDVTADMEKISKVPQPELGLSSGIRDGSKLLGNVALDIRQPQGAADSSKHRFEVNADRRRPKFVKLDDKVTGPNSYALTKKDVVDLLNAAKLYAGILEKANDNITSRAKSLKTSSFTQARYVASKGSGSTFINSLANDFGQAARLLATYPHIFLSLISRSFGHAEESAQTVLMFGERALKAAKRKAKEEKGEKRDS